MSIALLPEYIGAPSVGGRLSAVTGAERVTLGRLPSCGFLLLCFRPVPMPSAYGAGVVGIAPFRLRGAVFWSFSCDAGDVCGRCEKRPASFPVWGMPVVMWSWLGWRACGRAHLTSTLQTVCPALTI